MINTDSPNIQHPFCIEEALLTFEKQSWYVGASKVRCIEVARAREYCIGYQTGHRTLLSLNLAPMYGCCAMLDHKIGLPRASCVDSCYTK